MALYDAIVAAKHDRLSRADRSDEARIRLWAEEHGKKLILVDQDLQWPPRNAEDRQRWNNAAEQSRREWEATSKRYRRMQCSLRDGKYFIGKRSFGYRIVGINCGQSPCECDDDHKTLEIEESEAKHVRGIFRRYLAGQSLAQIRDWVISLGIPAMQGEVWSSQAIRRILHNPIYVGRVQYQGQTYMQCPAIVNPVDYDKVQGMLAGKATRGPQSKAPAMLTGSIQCSHGHKMYRMKGRLIPSVPDGLYYYCNPEITPKGQRLLIPLTYVDKFVSDSIMEDYGSFPHYVRKMSPGQQYANRIAEIRMDIKELNATDDDFMERVAGMRAEIKRLEALASRDADPKWVADRKDDGTVRTIGEVWESMDSGQKAQWLRANGWTVTVSKMEVSPAEVTELRAEGMLPFTITIDAGFTAEVSADSQLASLTQLSPDSKQKG
jgi:Recombinase